MFKSSTHLKQQFNVQKVTLTKALLLNGKRSSEKGLTLLECLVSILIVTAVIAAITPAIFLSVATRVQNRRAAQAQQLAQAEIDTVRRIVERGNYDNTKLPPSVGSPADLTVVPAPASDIWNRNISFNTTGSSSPSDCDTDVKRANCFRVQTFRTEGQPDPTQPTKPVAFTVGVRVYAGLAGDTPSDTRRASLGLTSATGSQARRPLAVLYTPITLSDNENSLRTLCNALPGGGGGACP